MVIIGLAGKKRVGKDTVADYMESLEWAEPDSGSLWPSTYFHRPFHKVPFAGPLKGAAAILLNLPDSAVSGESAVDREAVLPEWGFSVRDFLEVLGAFCRDSIRKDFFIHRLFLGLDTCDYDWVVISDVRYENEAEVIRGMGGSIWHIRRNSNLEEQEGAHESNKGIEVHPQDFVLENDGSKQQLYEKVFAKLKEILP